MSGVIVKKSEEMAAGQSGGGGGAAVELLQERSLETTKRHDDDAAEFRPLVSQPERRPLSRLQKLAPAKMQLRRLSPDSMGLPACRSPIPLLSPILVPPLGGGDLEGAGKQNPEEEEKSTVVSSHVIPPNGWQHPAAPF